jgi:hypothetical protein
MPGWGPKVLPGGADTPDGALRYPDNTFLPDPAKTVFNEVSSVIHGSWVDVLTFVVPVTPVVHVVRIAFGGENISKYQLLADLTVVDKYITWFNGTGLCGYWDFANSDGGGLRFNAGTVLKVQTNHYRVGMPADFFARLQYREIN